MLVDEEGKKKKEDMEGPFPEGGIVQPETDPLTGEPKDEDKAQSGGTALPEKNEKEGEGTNEVKEGEGTSAGKEPKQVNEKEEKEKKQGDQRPQGSGETVSVEEGVLVPFMREDGNLNSVLLGALTPRKNISDLYRDSVKDSLLEESNIARVEGTLALWEDVLSRKPASEGERNAVDDLRDSVNIYINNVKRLSNDVLGTDFQESEVPKEEIESDFIRSVMGSYSSSTVVPLGLMALKAGGLALGWKFIGAAALATAGFDALTASYGDVEELATDHEGLISELSTLVGGEGLFPSDPDDIYQMSRGEFLFRKLVARGLDVLALGAVGASIGKAVKGPAKVASLRKGIFKTSDVENGGEAVEALLRSEEEAIVNNIQRFRGTSKEEAQNLFNKMLEDFSSGGAEKFAGRKATVDLLNSSHKAVEDSLAFKKSMIHESSAEEFLAGVKDRVKGRVSHGNFAFKALKETEVDPLEEVGEVIDSITRKAPGTLSTKGFKEIDKALDALDEGILAVPGTTRTGEVPTEEVIEYLDSLSAKELLPYKGAKFTREGIFSVIRAQNRLFDFMQRGMQEGMEVTSLRKVQELQKRLDYLILRRGTEAGGNLQGMKIFQETRETQGYLLDELMGLRYRMEAGLISPKSYKKQMGKLSKQMNDVFKMSVEGGGKPSRLYNHLLRTMYNNFLGKYAVLRAATGNVANLFLEGFNNASFYRPDRAVRYTAQNYGEVISSVGRTFFRKEGLLEVKDAFRGRLPKGKQRLPHMDPINEEGFLEGLYTVGTNINIGALNTVDILTRDAVELAAGRSVILDVFERNARRGIPEKETLRKFLTSLKGDAYDVAHTMDFNRHVKKLTDTLFVREGLPLDYVNAKGETHSPLTLFASLISEASHKLREATHTLKGKNIVTSSLFGSLKLGTDAWTAFTNVTSQAVNYANDFIPLVGTRADVGRSGFHAIAKSINPKRLTRKQINFSLFFSSLYGLNTLLEDNKIQFIYPSGTDVDQFRRFGGREGIMIGDKFIEHRDLSTVGELFRLTHRAMDILKYPRNFYSSMGNEEAIYGHIRDMFTDFFDTVTGDTFLSNSYSTFVGDVMSGDLDRIHRNFDRLALNLLPWKAYEEKISLIKNEGNPLPLPLGLTEKLNSYKGAFDKLSELKGVLPEERLYDIFGNPATPEEDVPMTDSLYSSLGILLRSNLPQKNVPSELNEVRDLLLSMGAFSASKAIVINGKVIPKSQLPDLFHLTVRPASRVLTLPPYFEGESSTPVKMNYVTYNRRNKMLSLEYKKVHGQIDNMINYYKSYAPQSRGEKLWVSRALTSLNYHKHNTFSKARLKRLFPKYNEKTTLTHILHDASFNDSPRNKRALKHLKIMFLKKAQQDNYRLGLSPEELILLSERSARVQLIKNIYENTSKSVNLVMAYDPDIFEEIKGDLQ